MCEWFSNMCEWFSNICYFLNDSYEKLCSQVGGFGMAHKKKHHYFEIVWVVGSHTPTFWTRANDSMRKLQPLVSDKKLVLRLTPIQYLWDAIQNFGNKLYPLNDFKILLSEYWYTMYHWYNNSFTFSWIAFLPFALFYVNHKIMQYFNIFGYSNHCTSTTPRVSKIVSFQQIFLGGGTLYIWF